MEFYSFSSFTTVFVVIINKAFCYLAEIKRRAYHGVVLLILKKLKRILNTETFGLIFRGFFFMS